jgi:hypothetical protein
LNPVVLGFTFEYSDGTCLACGSQKATFAKAITLKRGEHIVGVDVTKGRYSPFPLKGVALKSSLGQTWSTEAYSNHMEGPPAFETPEGAVLFGLEFDVDKLSLKGIVSRPIKQLAPDQQCPQQIPSLRQLAEAAVPKAMRAEVVHLKHGHKLQRQQLKDKCQGDVDVVHTKARHVVEQSAEYATVVQLKKRLASAQQSLDQFKSQALHTATQAETARLCRYKGQSHGMKEQHREVLAETFSKHSQAVLEPLSCIRGHEELAICCFKDCRKIFAPEKQKARKDLCHVLDCPTHASECGAHASPCQICYLVVCHRHMDSHVEGCADVAEERCGYKDEEESINPDCCGKMLEEGQARQCFYCGTRCCKDCGDTCQGTDYTEYMYSGRPCGKVWCAACLKPWADVGESCCRECSFHGDKWVN